jgi:hypothetical protein
MPASPRVDPRHELYAWNFGADAPEHQDAFVTTFVDYNETIGAEVPTEDFVLIDADSAIVRFVGVGEDGEYENRETVIRGAPGEPLRMWEFMHHLHHQIHGFLVDVDDVFFEGLTVQGLRDGILVLELRQGS